MINIESYKAMVLIMDAKKLQLLRFLAMDKFNEICIKMNKKVALDVLINSLEI
jgi:hypothetical protein